MMIYHLNCISCSAKHCFICRELVYENGLKNKAKYFGGLFHENILVSADDGQLLSVIPKVKLIRNAKREGEIHRCTG